MSRSAHTEARKRCEPPGGRDGGSPPAARKCPRRKAGHRVDRGNQSSPPGSCIARNVALRARVLTPCGCGRASRHRPRHLLRGRGLPGTRSGRMGELERPVHRVEPGCQTIGELTDLVAEPCERREVRIVRARLRMNCDSAVLELRCNTRDVSDRCHRPSSTVSGSSMRSRPDSADANAGCCTGRHARMTALPPMLRTPLRGLSARRRAGWACSAASVASRCPLTTKPRDLRGFLRKAAGLGLEPRLPDPESGVLPLDDPAGRS